VMTHKTGWAMKKTQTHKATFCGLRGGHGELGWRDEGCGWTMK